MKNENVEKAVAILEETIDYAEQLLEGEIMLSLRVSKTMETLINGLKHVGGFAGDVTSSQDSASSVQPAKTFMGLDLEELKKEQIHAKVDVPTDEKEAFKQKVISLHSGFLDRDENQLKEALTKEELLGVAKLAGVPVADPMRQQVTLKLIREIKEAMTDAIKLEETKAAKVLELGQEGSGGLTPTGDNPDFEGNNVPNTGNGGNENQS